MTRYDEIIREHLPRYRRTHKAIKNLKDHGDTGENDVIDDLLHVIDCQQALIERYKQLFLGGRYYFAKCEACGFLASSEFFDGDEETIKCPICRCEDIDLEVDQSEVNHLGLILTVDDVLTERFLAEKEGR